MSSAVRPPEIEAGWLRVPGARVTGSCEAADVGVGNRTRDLCMSNTWLYVGCQAWGNKGMGETRVPPELGETAAGPHGTTTGHASGLVKLLEATLGDGG